MFVTPCIHILILLVSSKQSHVGRTKRSNTVALRAAKRLSSQEKCFFLFLFFTLTWPFDRPPFLVPEEHVRFTMITLIRDCNYYASHVLFDRKKQKKKKTTTTVLNCRRDTILKRDQHVDRLRRSNATELFFFPISETYKRRTNFYPTNFDQNYYCSFKNLNRCHSHI